MTKENEMSNMYELIENINTQVEERLANDTFNLLTNGADIEKAVGDRRAAYEIWVSEDCVVVKKDHDRTLQYYGGYEYIDKSLRMEVGDYVVYFDDGEVDGRVGRAIDVAFGREEMIYEEDEE
jgi:hypothetical protein